jgi:ribose 5-phosphate isomerase B
MRIGIAADHGGFAYKQRLIRLLRDAGHKVTDFGAASLTPEDDYPDFVVPMAQAIGRGKLERGVALCGSGVGACIAANKVPGVRAAVVHEIFSAHQGVEDDDMNVICIGGRVVGVGLAWDLVKIFIGAKYAGAERHKRRLAKVAELESARGPAA